MAELNAEIKSTRAALSVQFWEFCKGVEHSYYALVFTSNPRYNNPETWQSWADMGLHLAVKSPPTAVEPADSLKMTMRVDGKMFFINAVTSNGVALQKTCKLLTDVEAIRQSVQDKAPEARVETLLADPRVGGTLIQPLKQSLQRARLYENHVSEFLRAFERGLAAMTDETVVSVAYSYS